MFDVQWCNCGVSEFCMVFNGVSEFCLGIIMEINQPGIPNPVGHLAEEIGTSIRSHEPLLNPGKTH